MDDFTSEKPADVETSWEHENPPVTVMICSLGKNNDDYH
jgi:hypothetical protein